MGKNVALAAAILRNIQEIKTYVADKGLVPLESHLSRIIAMTEALIGRMNEEDVAVRCCFCRREAIGRLVFCGPKQRPVDNPFCVDHEVSVREQTKRSLKVMGFKTPQMKETILTQRWKSGDLVPIMPLNFLALLHMAAGYNH